MLRRLIIFSLLLSACDQQDGKKDDTVLRAPTDPADETTDSWSEWQDARFKDATGSFVTLAAADLATGTPPGNIQSTYAVANLPVGLFSTGLTLQNQVSYAPLPYIAFRMDRDAAASVRYVKSVSGKNMQSMAIVPRECPATLQGPAERTHPKKSDAKIAVVSMCIPLINQIVPDYLKPTDALGVYGHTFIVAVKNPGASAGVTLTTKLSINILIPDSKLSMKETDELKALRMRDRLLITSNDLAGSPRRDFKAVVISSELPPGVETKWRLRFTDFKMKIEEEVFFELPVAPGTGRLKPTVARGMSFLKRSTLIDSERNFRLRVMDDYDATAIMQLQPTGSTQAEIPIKNGSAPLRLIVMPDFKSDAATMSMSQYVKPFYPVFCKDQAQIFKPEEWRQASLNIAGFVACDAKTKTKIASSADAATRRITSPVETFFGSFTYKAMSGEALGGMSGVISMRVTVEGRLEVSVIDPMNPLAALPVASANFSFGYNLPSALTDMRDVIRGANVPAGLDAIYNAIPSKGVIDPPYQPDGRPPFPFIEEWSDNVFF